MQHHLSGHVSNRRLLHETDLKPVAFTRILSVKANCSCMDMLDIPKRRFCPIALCLQETTESGGDSEMVTNLVTAEADGSCQAEFGMGM